MFQRPAQFFHSGRLAILIMASALIVSGLIVPGVSQLRTVHAVGFSCDSVTTITMPECAMLVALYNNTNGSSWTNHTNWEAAADPCTWFGVTCASGHVTQLALGSNNLSGSTAGISSLGGLANLQTLDLSHNQLSGAIPSVSGATALQSLNFSNNQLTGSVPDLPASLTYLNVSSNLLNGTIPDSLRNTAITTGNLSLCGTGNNLTPATTAVNTFIASVLPGWSGKLCTCDQYEHTDYYCYTG